MINIGMAAKMKVRQWSVVVVTIILIINGYY